MSAFGISKNHSNGVKAAAGNGEGVGDPQSLNGAVQLQRTDTRTMRDQTASNVDLAGRAAGFDTERNAS
jgi:hypothetical protein